MKAEYFLGGGSLGLMDRQVEKCCDKLFLYMIIAVRWLGKDSEYTMEEDEDDGSNRDHKINLRKINY